MNRIRDTLAKNVASKGCFVNFYAPNVVESLGLAGFNFIIIDNEHGFFSHEQIETMILAAESVGIDTIVRVDYDASAIQKALDLGAAGVLVPMVYGAQNGAAIIRKAKYEPMGGRGVDFYSRACRRYKPDERGYLRAQNEDTLVILQIETKEALDAVDDILDLPGLGAVFIGAMDLSIALGEPTPATERMQQAVSSIYECARKKNVPVGTVFMSAEAAQTSEARGAKLLVTTVMNLIDIGAKQVLR